MSTDDELRNIFHENVEPIEPPPGVADQLAARVTETIAASGAGGSGVSIPFIVALAAISGLLIGGLLGFIESGKGPAPTATLAAAPIYSCPGNGEVGTLHRGDRVVLIGQSGDWIAVRNVRGSLERVFIHSDYVTPDADADLPEANCDESGVLVVAGEEIALSTTTTADPVETTTTTVDGGATTTTNSPTTTPPTTVSTTSSTTTTTVAPDTTAPAIAQEGASAEEIWEQDGQGISCTSNPPYPRQSMISAIVTDNMVVTSVRASWNGSSGSTTRTMTQSGSTYSAVFGPFAPGTWDAANLFPYDHLVTITISASDASGNTSTASVPVTVWEIGSCFG